MSVESLTELAWRCNENSKAHGFWVHYGLEGEVIGLKLALIHSEVSEALEEHREHGLESYFREDGKPEGFGSELADVIIRVLDLAGHYDIPIESEVLMKMRFNETRPYKHGKSY